MSEQKEEHLPGMGQHAAALALITRQMFKNRVLVQLYRFWAPAESTGDASVAFAETVCREVFAEGFVLENKAAGYNKTGAEWKEGLPAVTTDQRNAHKLLSLTLDDDMAGFSARLLYAWEKGGETMQVELAYKAQLSTSAKELLPRLTRIEINKAPDAAPEKLDKFVPMLATNRKASLVVYWLGLVEAANYEALNATVRDLAKPIVADGIKWDSPSGKMTGFEELSAFLAGLPARMAASCHFVDSMAEELADDAVDVKMKWHGVAINNVVMEAETHHKWTVEGVDDAALPFPKILSVNVEFIVPFRAQA